MICCFTNDVRVCFAKNALCPTARAFATLNRRDDVISDDEGPLSAADFQTNVKDLDDINQKPSPTKFTRKFTKSVYANDTSNTTNVEASTQKQNIFVENREQVENENKKVLSGYELQEKKQAWARKAESKHQEVLSRLRSQKSAGETDDITRLFILISDIWFFPQLNMNKSPTDIANAYRIKLELQKQKKELEVQKNQEAEWVQKEFQSLKDQAEKTEKTGGFFSKFFF